IRSAVLFFPCFIRLLTNRATNTLLYFGSGRISRLVTSLLLGMASSLRSLGAVFGTALLAVLHPGGIEGTANDMIAHAGEVLPPAPAHQDHGMFLEVMAHPGNIGGYFIAVCQ